MEREEEDEGEINRGLMEGEERRMEEVYKWRRWKEEVDGKRKGRMKER